jgi:hypothetical protein
VTYDSDSAVHTGIHEGRTIYYVFARYPQSSGNQYPVHDLVRRGIRCLTVPVSPVSPSVARSNPCNAAASA